MIKAKKTSEQVVCPPLGFGEARASTVLRNLKWFKNQ